MTTPPSAPSRSRKRSRLFQAAPDALQVEEWVPNITLPPPPDAPLEEEEGVVQLDEHGLPERDPEEEEPEEERRGPARIYVGQGAPTSAAPPTSDELPVSDVDMPNLQLPGPPVEDDDEADSEGELPDLSIDGSGSNWGAMFDTLDDEQPTDPEIETGPQDDASAPMPMPSAVPLAKPASEPAPEPTPTPAPPAEPRPVAPKVAPAPKLEHIEPRPIHEARPTPSWARSGKAPVKPEAPKPAKPQPPRIRATQPKSPEPGLGSLVPRSLIIAAVILVILLIFVWVITRPSDPPATTPGTPPPVEPAEPTEVTIEPRSLDLEAPPPAPEPEPVEEPERSAPAVEEPEPVRTQPERTRPAPVATPTPRPTPPPAPEPEPQEPEPAATADGPGFMVVESDRYAMIYMGGRRLGGTPIARMELEPGSYAVRAVCRDTGATKTMQVEIQPGELATASFRFMP